MKIYPFSLYDAVEMLCNEKIHRLPAFDSSNGDVLYIITHKRIMKYLYLYVSHMLPFYLKISFI
jgi:5'-AMP-activated protein kinase, regulatory gamma subunit